MRVIKKMMVAAAMVLPVAAMAQVPIPQARDNQYYTSAEVFEATPVYGKSSPDCITCESVLVGYKLGIRVIQKTHTGADKAIIFDTITKQYVQPGTWVKVGMRVDLVVPVKAMP